MAHIDGYTEDDMYAEREGERECCNGIRIDMYGWMICRSAMMMMMGWVREERVSELTHLS